MSVKEPNSMNEVIYFTRRSIGSGKVVAWVYKEDCSKCGKAKMGKPVVKGKVKIRAKEYVCPSCGNSEPKEAHEESLTLEAKYTCPHCNKEGEGTCPYKLKSFKGAKSYIVECEHCNEKIPVTKKMKKVDI